MFYLWVPAVTVYYIVYSWLSKQNNEYGGKWIYIAYIYGMICPFWIYVSVKSKNLLFDGMLYDNIMFLTYVFTMLYLGVGDKLQSHQQLGLILIVLGSVLIRIHV